jgi:hypothetical protein
MIENTIGIQREVEFIAHKLGLHGDRAKAFVEFTSKWGSKLKVLLKKTPFFDDPVYSFWTLAKEFWEYGEKTGEHIVGGVAGHGH